jgi:hypothetical protein
MNDLEIWLIGTPDQVAAAMTALTTTGRIAGASKPEPMFGADAGRVRRYVRLSVPMTRTRPNPTGGETQAAIDFAA